MYHIFRALHPPAAPSLLPLGRRGPFPHLQVWLLGDGLPLGKLHHQAQRLGQLRHHPHKVPLRHCEVMAERGSGTIVIV